MRRHFPQCLLKNPQSLIVTLSSRLVSSRLVTSRRGRRAMPMPRYRIQTPMIPSPGQTGIPFRSGKVRGGVLAQKR